MDVSSAIVGRSAGLLSRLIPWGIPCELGEFDEQEAVHGGRWSNSPEESEKSRKTAIAVLAMMPERTVAPDTVRSAGQLGILQFVTFKTHLDPGTWDRHS
eukprot:s1855_g6.t1